MKKEAVNIRENKVEKNKKTGLIIGSIALIFLIGATILCWRFNRKFEVTFDYNNGTKENIVLVRYKKLIKNEDIKNKDDLGESFIGWYDVTKDKDGKEIVSEKEYDFNTLIKQKTYLRALYEDKKEKITITFDSKGGTPVNSITLEVGQELTLPANPTKSGYTFKVWETKNGTPIYDKALLSESITLYAVWDKKETQNTTPNQENNSPTNNNKPIEVTKVQLNATSKAMIVNTKDKLVATVTPDNASNKTVSWSSNNPSVITVDQNGNLKAVGLGEATITVKTANGKVATAKVTSDVKSITLNVANNTISKYGTIKSTKINVNIDSNGYNVPNSLITWSAPDTTGYTSAASMSTNGKTATLTARDVWGSTVSSIPVTVKINNKEAKTTIYVEPKISISNNNSSGVTCNESNGRMLCTFKGEKNFYLQSNIDVSWEYNISSPVIAGIEGKDARNLKLSVQYVAENGLNIKARSKAGQVKEIVLTPTAQY